MKKSSITTKKMKLETTTKFYEKVIDEHTGEVKFVETSGVVYKIMGERDTNFMKMFTNNMLNVIKEFFGGAKADIFNVLIKNADKDNCIFATQLEIAEACNTSREEVNKILKSLEKCGFIKKIKNGVYQINVDYLFKGSSTQRQKAKEKFAKPLLNP